MITGIVIVSCLICAFIISALFEGAETAIASLEYSALTREPASLNSKSGGLFFMWEKFPWRVLNALLLGNTLCVILISVMTTYVAHIITASTGISFTLTVLVCSMGITVGTIVFCQLIPKIIARRNPVATFNRVAPFIAFVERVILPVTRIVTDIMFWLTHKLGIRLDTPHYKVTEHDILEFLDIGAAEGIIGAGEKEVIASLVQFGDHTVRDIMTPRATMDCINISDGLDAMIRKANALKYSRIPVYEGTMDNLVGVVYAKDLLIAWNNKDLIIVQDLLRPVYFIPPTKKLSELLREFKQGHHHLAIVTDEYGVVLGMVTIEDILEEIVGDIFDEYDTDDPLVVPLKDGGFSVHPHIELATLDKKLGLSLEKDAPEEVRTLSAYLMFVTGKIPKKNDIIRKNNCVFFVNDVVKHVIKKVIVYKEQGVL